MDPSIASRRRIYVRNKEGMQATERGKTRKVDTIEGRSGFEGQRYAAWNTKYDKRRLIYRRKELDGRILATLFFKSRLSETDGEQQRDAVSKEVRPKEKKKEPAGKAWAGRRGGGGRGWVEGREKETKRERERESEG